MIKDLEISDWEPAEIAVMIEEQISSLVPNWESQTMVATNYEEEEEDDMIINQPFYASSSCSSSQASLLPLNSPKSLPVDPVWIQGK